MKHKKILTFSLGLMMMASPVYAVVDPFDVVMNLLRQIQSGVEVVENITNNKRLDDLNKLLGKKGAINSKIVDLGSQLDYKKYAPTLTDDLQKIVGDKGYESIPSTRKFVQKKLSYLNTTDVAEQAAVLVEINERLNISSMDAFQTAKNVSALTNKAKKEASSQLSVGAAVDDMHKKLVQEAGQDIKRMKKDISYNQLNAQMLKTKSMGVIANMQHSTSSGEKEEQGGSNEKNN